VSATARSSPIGSAVGPVLAIGLEHLFKHPIVSMNEIANLIGVTYAAANHLVERLTAVRALAEITRQTRNGSPRYDPYIRLFAEELNGLGGTQ
jgi:hypothetical protein